jgi:hypothetical protein
VLPWRLPRCQLFMHTPLIVLSARLHFFMNPSASSAASLPGCKENPFHKTSNACLRTHQCPYHGKPAQLHERDFQPHEPVQFEDNYCDTCQSAVVACPAPPPPPPPPPPPFKWVLLGLGGLLLGTLAWGVNQCQTRPSANTSNTEAVDSTVVQPEPPGPETGGGNSTATPPEKEKTRPTPGDVPAQRNVPAKPEPRQGVPFSGEKIQKDPNGQCVRYLYEKGKIVGSEVLDPSACQ